MSPSSPEEAPSRHKRRLMDDEGDMNSRAHNQNNRGPDPDQAAFIERDTRHRRQAKEVFEDPGSIYSYRLNHLDQDKADPKRMIHEKFFAILITAELLLVFAPLGIYVFCFTRTRQRLD